MRHLAALLVASVALIVAATPVGAGGVVAHPGEIATGYLELTEYEVADLVDARIAAGDLDADKVYKTSTGIILFGTPVDLLIDAGVIREFYVDRVLAIIECESSGRWNAVGSEIKHLDMVALGLLQHLDGYWLDRAAKAEAAGYHNHGDIWSPTDQMAVSAWLAYNTPQGFGHWVCDKGGGQ